MTRADSVEKRLAEAVLALAREPDGGHRPGELAVEFDEAYTDYVAHLEQLPSHAQLESLQALDAALAAVSGPAHSELWTERAFRSHPLWTEIRALASAVAARFGWRSD